MKIMRKMQAAGRRAAAFAVALVMAVSMAVAPLATAAAYADDSSSSVVSDASEGVVRILTIKTASGYVKTTNEDESYTLEPVTYIASISYGSGFGIGETVGEATDIFATNRHVVTDDDYDVSEIWVLFDDSAATISVDYSYYVDASGNKYYSYSYDVEIDETKAVRADIIYASEDENPDVAVIQTRSVVSSRVALALEPSENVSVGESVWAIGFPGDSDSTNASEETATGYKHTVIASISSMTVTQGYISRIVDVDSCDGNTYIQHTASVSGGNSGGPLLNEDGAVIGINSFIYAGDTDTDYYSIEIDYLIAICEAEGIPYALADGGDSVPVALIAALVAVVVVVVVAVVLVSRKKKTAEAGSAPAPVSEPAPAPATAPAPVIEGDSGFRIQCQSGTFAGRRFAIAGQLRLGRDPSKNDLVFPGDTKGISGVHCVLGVDTMGQVTLMDLGSTYGTYLEQGQRLAAHQPVTLKVGDVFYLGSTEQRFELVRKGGR